MENFNNIYLSLAESSYIGSSKEFPKYQISNEIVEINYRLDAIYEDGNRTKGGQNLPNDGIVYLQPDNTVKTVKEKWLGTEKEYQKGLLTDEKAGYNSYFVTDTPTLNTETKHTYFATRGSDAIAMNTLNDWVVNNGSFTVFNSYIPQAKLATKAMHQKITEISVQAPNATMSITGHSLGTMVSIQAVANLPEEDIAKIDKVVLFQGPDARESINKMSEQARRILYY